MLDLILEGAAGSCHSLCFQRSFIFALAQSDPVPLGTTRTVLHGSASLVLLVQVEHAQRAGFSDCEPQPSGGSESRREAWKTCTRFTQSRDSFTLGAAFLA